MDNFFNKLENYNIFNYILPAIIFDIGCKIYINLTIISTSNVVIAAFAYYFVGLVISRIGSLIIKPLLWKLKKKILRLKFYLQIITCIEISYPYFFFYLL